MEDVEEAYDEGEILAVDVITDVKVMLPVTAEVSLALVVTALLKLTRLLCEVL